MLALGLISVLALLQVSEPADAPSRQTMTREIVRACVAEIGTQSYNPTPSCACTAGWLSAQLNYRDFYVVGRMYHFATDAAGMETEVARLVREGGYAPEEILRVARFLQDSEAEMTAACGFLER
ncbi:MAG: hypothetical protein ACI82N_001306 [Maricaulis sp.]|jgi:hypothetical protein